MMIPGESCNSRLSLLFSPILCVQMLRFRDVHLVSVTPYYQSRARNQLTISRRSPCLSHMTEPLPPDSDILEESHTVMQGFYHVSLTEISEDFRKRLEEGYKKDTYKP